MDGRGWLTPCRNRHSATGTRPGVYVSIYCTKPAHRRQRPRALCDATNTAIISPRTFCSRSRTLASTTRLAGLTVRLRMLRSYLARPGPRSVLHKSVGFGGASYISLSLSTPIRIESKEISTMAASDHPDSAQGGQQSMLASQRAKEQGEAQGRFSKWFPLSAKAGFEQWWAGLSPMATEHRVLSFVPHLQSPPTHTQTGTGSASAVPSSVDLHAPPKHTQDHTTTNTTI
jgi:hypothetical protein